MSTVEARRPAARAPLASAAAGAAAAALARLLSGPFARAQAVLGAVEPKLAPMTRALTEALRHAEAGRIAFEVRRADALSRVVGKVLLALEAAREQLKSCAGDDEYEAVQREIGDAVQQLGIQHRRLGDWIVAVNALRTRAAKAVDAAQAAQSRHDEEWEKLKATADELAERTAGFAAHTRWLEKLIDASQHSSSNLDAAAGKVEAARRFATECAIDLRALNKRFEHLQGMAGLGLTTPALAQQIRAQGADLRRQLDVLELPLRQLEVAEKVLQVRRENLDTRGIAIALDVPHGAVVRLSPWIAGSPAEQMKALVELAKVYTLEQPPKALRETLRKRGLVK